MSLSSSLKTLAGKIKRGDDLASARGISVLEDSPTLGKVLMNHLKRGKTSKAFLIGVTGSAGSGKSTLIAGLARVARRRRKKVAVIAVDPTSAKHGGAFLADRVRMQKLAEDPGVFIRSMASRGARGGVAHATRDTAFLLARAGYDYVLIETVGAGQLDDEVTHIAHKTLLLLTPESGDEMQLMKSGLHEEADVFVVNKSDRPGAEQMVHLLKKDGRPVFKTVAEQEKGIEPLWRFLEKR